MESDVRGKVTVEPRPAFEARIFWDEEHPVPVPQYLDHAYRTEFSGSGFHYCLSQFESERFASISRILRAIVIGTVFQRGCCQTKQYLLAITQRIRSNRGALKHGMSILEDPLRTLVVCNCPDCDPLLRLLAFVVAAFTLSS